MSTSEMALVVGRRAARGPFAYREVLTQRLAEAEAQPKTARTRLKLMAGVVAVLEEDGVHELRVANCAARAGVSHGTFYNYWPDGSAAAQAVLSDFMATVTARRPGAPAGASAHQRILAANRYYVVVYRRNAQLMRCLMQLGNAEPDFARIGQAANLALARRVVRGWERAEPEAAALPEAARLARALACIAMVEGVLRELYVRPSPAPLAGMGDEEVAQLLSDCWYRLLFGREPP
ncbi:TetR/AcrR family transcriptional regulator [Falsiroseomonas sp.]|uniref:TetR/AcrR family transcriptional regulator n=1 Tax=Falsiroseomonas sp. TaxID=2870721 RepID=UPI0035679085